MLYVNGISTYIFVLLHFLLMLVVHWVGLWLRLHRLDEDVRGIGTIEGALLGLLALLLTFTFGMANERYDARRDLIIQDANAIGTAIFRADLCLDTIR